MFNYLGTMRQCQWKAFRDWMLTERRATSSRLRVINAELRRIGRITVFYRRRVETVQTADGAEQQIESVTEEREAFYVSQGSSLEKLVQAYIACGGNPMSISLWLQPDEILFTTDSDPIDDPDDDPNEFFTDAGAPSSPYDQPYGGVVAPKSTDSYGPGGQYPGGLPTFIRDPTNLAGRYFNEGSAGAKIAIRLDQGRRWARQTISEITALEQRIIKLMDLREQFLEERDTLIQQAIGGSVPDFPLAPDEERYARNLHLTRIVTEMDRTFYEVGSDGEPDFTTVNLGTKSDDGQVSPSGIAYYDSLFSDPPGTDPFATG
jgi:hypothetical protein